MVKSYQLCATTLWVAAIVILLPVLCYGTNKYSESDAAKFLEKANREVAQWTGRAMHAQWNCSTNFTNANAVKMYDTNEEYNKFLAEIHREAIKYPWTTYKDPNIKRQLKLFSQLATVGLPEEKQKKLDRTVATMKTIFDNVRIPVYRNEESNRSLNFDPGLTALFETSSDPDELKHVWKHWTKSTGDKIKHLYPEYVKLSNEAARANNHNNTADFWTSKYEMENFRGLLEHLWQQIRPLYLQIHAYTRRKLWKRYGDSVITRRGPIPLHLLNDMWTQSWERMANFSLPFPDAEDIDPTSALKKQNYTSKSMFERAEAFMTSLNFSAMPHSFWEKSIFKQPGGRVLNNHLCEISVWDFCDSKDYRIKEYASVNFEEFVDAHKKMAVIQYHLQYKDQPYIYREGPIEGFQEIVGDVIALSVSTPKHLNTIGVLPRPHGRTPEANINYLYEMGLKRIAYLPLEYLTDMWRWNVFEETIPEEHYNCDWWELRYNFQGIEPPVTRSDSDFDPGSMYNVVGNVPYIKHFVNFFIRFQIYQALCEKAGQYLPLNPNKKPLHQCDVYQSAAAGNALKEMMELGKSKHWLDALETLTGKREVDAIPMLNYFRPLQSWLEKENRRTGELIGWRSSKTTCIRTVPKKSVLDHLKHTS